jgi:hypothetical protein
MNEINHQIEKYGIHILLIFLNPHHNTEVLVVFDILELAIK